MNAAPPINPEIKTPGGERAVENPSDARRRWLENHRSRLQADRASLLERESRWSWGRLLVFLLVISVWYPFSGLWPVALAAIAASIVLFVFTVRRHIVAKQAREFFDRLVLIADESLQRCGGRVIVIRGAERPHGRMGGKAAGPNDWEEIEKTLKPILTVERTWPLTGQERDDLDLYSEPVGLYGLLNRTSTMLGSLRLRDCLENPLLDSREILDRQAAVKWLDDHPAERMRMMAALASLRGEEKSMQGLISAIRGAKPVLEPTSLYTLRAWSIVSGAFVAWSIAGMALGQKDWLWPALAVLGINGLIGLFIRGRVHEQLEPWQNVLGACVGYLEAATHGSANLPQDQPQLAALKERLASVLKPDSLPGVRRRAGWSEGGGLVGELLNLAALYELHVAEAILTRAIPHRDELLEGISALADLEMLLSLGTFAWEQPVRAYPVTLNDVAVQIRSGRHVLLAPERAVPNDVQLGAGQRLMVITGSNMSGKSTYLRMTGVNVLLAQVGTVAIAEEMRWSPLRLLTDLRAQDSLSRDESYFLAEVRQLRRMFAAADEQTPILGLIDEPLRGTNSQEQVAASLAVVEHLAQSQNLFMVATHDEKLTKLVADGIAAGENFHFQEDLGSAGMIFDYRLRTGPARTRNALRVLERESYPEAVVARARWWLGKNAE